MTVVIVTVVIVTVVIVIVVIVTVVIVTKNYSKTFGFGLIPPPLFREMYKSKRHFS